MLLSLPVCLSMSARPVSDRHLCKGNFASVYHQQKVLSRLMLLDKAVGVERDVDLNAPDVIVKRRLVSIQTLNSQKYLASQSDNKMHIHRWKIKLKAEFVLIQKRSTTHCMCVGWGGASNASDPFSSRLWLMKLLLSNIFQLKELHHLFYSNTRVLLNFIKAILQLYKTGLSLSLGLCLLPSRVWQILLPSNRQWSVIGDNWTWSEHLSYSLYGSKGAH